MAKNKNRWKIQAAATLLSNANIAGFFTGKLYKGSLKAICVPGLNCYSCPGAVGSCPIGALQAVFVIILPMTIVNEVGTGDPWFCKGVQKHEKVH